MAKEKCPCETDATACCACVSMHCDECHKPNQSKFVQGRFCSNCGRPLKAELTRLYVPKREVDEIVRQWKEEANCWQNNYITELRANEQIRVEVAREIFEEIAREVYSKIPDKILPITIKEMSRELDYGDGLNFGRRDAYFDTLKIIAELKKKYTEGEA